MKVNSSVSLPDKIRNLVEEIAVKKLKVSLLQKLMMPNRKYFPIPKSKELSVKYLQKIIEQSNVDQIEIETNSVMDDLEFLEDSSSPFTDEISEESFNEKKNN